jgi:hypothetical protein
MYVCAQPLFSLYSTLGKHACHDAAYEWAVSVFAKMLSRNMCWQNMPAGHIGSGSDILYASNPIYSRLFAAILDRSSPDKVLILCLSISLSSAFPSTIWVIGRIHKSSKWMASMRAGDKVFRQQATVMASQFQAGCTSHLKMAMKGTAP